MNNDDNRNIVCGIIGGFTVLLLDYAIKIFCQEMTNSQKWQLIAPALFSGFFLLWLSIVTNKKSLNKVNSIKQILNRKNINTSAISNYNNFADLYRQYMQREIGKVEFCRILNIDRPTLDKLIEEFTKTAD